MRRTLTLATCAMAIALTGPPPAGAASYRSCVPVVDPYPNSRYEGVDLSRIRALRASCATARTVARGAHFKALGLPASGPVRRFTWNGWRVSGDLRGDSDRYVASKGKRRVRWRF